MPDVKCSCALSGGTFYIKDLVPENIKEGKESEPTYAALFYCSALSSSIKALLSGDSIYNAEI